MEWLTFVSEIILVESQELRQYVLLVYVMVHKCPILAVAYIPYGLRSSYPSWFCVVCVRMETPTNANKSHVKVVLVIIPTLWRLKFGPRITYIASKPKAHNVIT